MDEFDSLLADDADQFFQFVALSPPSASVPQSGDAPTTTQQQQTNSPSLIRTNPNRRLLGGEAGKDAYDETEFGGFAAFVKNKRMKLDNQRRADIDDLRGAGPNSTQAEGSSPARRMGSNIFKGLCIYINGLTTDAGIGQQQLARLVTLHGGTMVPFLDRKGMITHIVASTLTPSKMKEFAAYKCARPEWLMDSLSAGKLLHWANYSLHSVDSAVQSSQVDRSTTVVTAQPSLFAMGVKRPASATPAAANTETMDDLAARGRRLGQLAVAQTALASPNRLAEVFAVPKSPVKSSTSTSPAAVKSPRRLPPPTTDHNGPPSWMQTNSYMPSEPADRRGVLNDPEFLAEHTSRGGAAYVQNYFSKSRLHHLSTWKEQLKVLVADLQQPAAAAAAAAGGRPRALTGTEKDERTVLHIDFDCFFVTAGLTSRPELRGKPVAVCHGSTEASAGSTSEIASCSYEARAFGVKNGISLGKARDLCPEIQTIPFEFELYEKISRTFYAIVHKYAKLLQAVSIDEVLIEVQLPPRTQLVDHALDLADKIRTEVREATGCEVSVGVGHNILLAKLASRKAKPAGAVHLLPEQVDEHLAQLDVRELPGIGWSKADLLAENGVKTVGELRAMRSAKVSEILGPAHGKQFAAYARGIDPRELDVGKPRKSVSAEINYGIRFTHDPAPVEAFLLALSEEVARRLRVEGLKARRVTLKIKARHPDSPLDPPKFLGHGWTVDSSESFDSPTATDQGTAIAAAVSRLLKKMAIPPPELRGIGIQLLKLEKDGRPVDAMVLERGQGTLNFGAAPAPAAAAPVSKKRDPPPPQLPLAESPEPEEGRRAQKKARVTTPPIAEPLTQSPARNKKAPPKPIAREVLTLDDSDDEDGEKSPTLAAAAVPERAKTARPAPAPAPAPKKVAAPPPAPAPIVPRMFTKAQRRRVPLSPSQVTEEHLVHYGIGLEYYADLDRAQQLDVLAAAQATKGPPPKNARAGKSITPLPPAPAPRAKSVQPQPNERLALGGVSKAGLLGRTKSKTPVDIDLTDVPTQAPPPRIVLPDATPPTSPSNVTDEQLAVLRLDPEVFRHLPREMQTEELALKRSLRVKSTRSKRAGPGGAAGELPVVEISMKPSPRFHKMTTTAEVRDAVERWFDAIGSSGPPQEDLDRLARYCNKLAQKGGDLARVVDVLGWLKMLIEDGWGGEEEVKAGAREAGKAQRRWWTGYASLRETVQTQVKKETGKTLLGL